MRFFENYEDFIAENTIGGQGTAVAIGNFDGCHRGHKKLLAHITETATQLCLVPLVFTFSPHPRVFFSSLPQNDLLFDLAAKNEALQALGVKMHLAQKFNEKFRSLSPQDFVQQVLLKSLNAKYVVVGENFKFGKNRAGNSAWLLESLKTYGVDCKIFGHVNNPTSHTIISSSEIRKLLKGGQLEDANNLLGYDYTITGPVEKGNQQGKKLGFPTANLRNINQLVPKNGVYACKVRIVTNNLEGDSPIEELVPQFLDAVVNCGTRPTLTKDKQPTVEAHIYENSRTISELYGKTLVIKFVARLRDEIKFSNKEALISQIKSDIDLAKIKLAEHLLAISE